MKHGKNGAIFAFLLLIVSSACKEPAAEESGEPCGADILTKPTCSGSSQMYCSDSGTTQSFDCASRGESCLTDADGGGYCGQLCPVDLASFGYCDSTKRVYCDGQLLQQYECSQDRQSCAYSEQGYAYCTVPCPLAAGEVGVCNGTRLSKCSGGVAYDGYDCAQDGLTCQVDGTGEPFCTAPCPPGLDAFGRCTGHTVERCENGVFSTYSCGDDPCEVTTRYGAGCRGCDGVPTEGQCVGEKFVHSCRGDRLPHSESCVAFGGKCGFDAAQCRFACLGGSPGPSCASRGMTEGQARCKQNTAYGFWSIETCSGGTVSESECPAAADGSVGCEESPDGPHCVTSGCEGRARRCTDRGVLLRCDDPSFWSDCRAYGGECVDDDDSDSHCTCRSDLSTACTNGTRDICVDDRIVSERCRCDGP